MDLFDNSYELSLSLFSLFTQTMTVYNLHDSSVKLIDFGLSATTNDRRIRDTNLRQNRSPEMLMGWGWMEPSDVWALG